MLSLEQVKHVLTYYFLEMLRDGDNSVPTTHIQRDCVFLNKSRGEICSDVYSNPKLRYVIGLIHEARDIHQINSVPVNSVCCIDNKKIPISSAGIQFIIYKKNSNTHVCVQKKYQPLCYAYFKLRHFDKYIQKAMLSWLSKQPWYLPRAMSANALLKRVLDSNFPEVIHRELEEIVDTLG